MSADAGGLLIGNQLVLAEFDGEGTFFALLDPEHIGIIRMFLEDRKANGTL